MDNYAYFPGRLIRLSQRRRYHKAELDNNIQTHNNQAKTAESQAWVGLNGSGSGSIDRRLTVSDLHFHVEVFVNSESKSTILAFLYNQLLKIIFSIYK